MSQQLQITGGAKVRSLEGVITGTSGVLSSVPLGAANGVATLDSGGKVPVSQLPSSVVTYLGTWNAATNTPALVNGTGDAGDLYICNVAGTVNFGAGPITFAVGDWVLYGSGTWQKSSGQNGTVTSVAASITGNAVGITGSPITTAGTLAFAFAGTNLQYVNGAGNLSTFPILTGYVPYTGATADVDLDTHVLNAQALHVKGTAGAGHLGLKHQSASPTGSANESLIFADVNGDMGWLNGNLYLHKFVTSANTANRTYTFPNATGTVALTSDLSGYVTGSGSTGRVAFWNGASSISSNSNLYWDNSTSRLGIGTNTPNASLGILNSSSTGLQVRTSDSANQYQANIYWDSSYGMVYGYNRLGTGTASNLSFYNSLGGFLSVPESSNNNIGFNTLNPQGSSATTVYDFTSLSTSVEIRLHNPTTGYTSTDGSYIKVTPTALVIANVETASQILINNGGNGVITIDGTNNVAIGNIGVIPMTQQLTVVGSIQAYGGSIYQTVTSSMLKANASGQIIAAVGGTDYEYPLTFSSPLVRTTNTISIPAATTSVSGYLTSTDWNTFNNKGSGTVTSVTGTAPVVSSGGTTPAISMAAATTSVSGYLTSTDWNTFNGKFTLPSLTSGSVLFSDGSTIAQNNTRLYWDNTNMKLGIGTQAVAQYVTYIAANVGENANAWLGIENKNTTGSAAVRLLLNGSVTSGFQYVQSTNLTQIYANAGDILLSNGSSLGLTIANTTGNATFSASATATSFVKTGGTSSQFLKADGSVDSSAYIVLGSLSATSPIFYNSSTGVISSQAASASAAGYVTTGTQTIAGAKTFSSSIVASGTGNITLGATSSDNFPLFQLVDNRVGGKQWNIENGRTSAGLLEFYSNTVGTVVTITQAGAGTFSSTLQATKIGIGGAPSAFILDVNGTGRFTGALTGTSATFSGNLTVDTNTLFVDSTNKNVGIGTISISQPSAGATTLRIVGTATTKGGAIYLDSSDSSVSAYIYPDSASGLSINTSTSHPITFRTNGTTRLTIAATTGAATFSSGIATLGYTASTSYAALFNGSVGIGTVSPNAKLNVVNDDGVGVGLHIIADFNRSTSSAELILGYYGDGTSVTTNAIYSANSLPLAFYTGATERLRISSGGTIEATGNSSTGYSLTLGSSQATSPNIVRFYSTTDTNNTNQFIMCDAAASVQRMSVRTNGGIYNYSANNSNLSDERLKKDIILLESYWDKFKDIEIVKFKYKDQTHDDYNIGVIAQQVEKIAPEFIDADSWDMNNVPQDGIPIKSVYESDLHHATIKVLQEAMAKIEEQQAIITSLQDRLDKLENK